MWTGMTQEGGHRMDRNEPSYIPLKARAPADRPRERLRQVGSDKLSNAELLAILIRGGTEGRSAIHVAEDLLSKAGSLQNLSIWTPVEIKRTKGMGRAKTATLAAIFELTRRLRHPPPPEKVSLRWVDDVAGFFRHHYGTGPPEKFIAFYINRNYGLLGQLEVSRGNSNAVVVDPQRIFREALLHNAKAIILAHNHPGGNLQPSPDDIAITNGLQVGGKFFSIPIIDHVILTEYGYFSFDESGLLKVLSKARV